MENNYTYEKFDSQFQRKYIQNNEKNFLLFYINISLSEHVCRSDVQGFYWIFMFKFLW
jgi:hypothetical protein